MLSLPHSLCLVWTRLEAPISHANHWVQRTEAFCYNSEQFVYEAAAVQRVVCVIGSEVLFMFPSFICAFILTVTYSNELMGIISSSSVSTVLIGSDIIIIIRRNACSLQSTHDHVTCFSLRYLKQIETMFFSRSSTNRSSGTTFYKSGCLMDFWLFQTQQTEWKTTQEHLRWFTVRVCLFTHL